MAATRLLGISLAASVVLLGFAACKGSSGASSTGSGGASSSSGAFAAGGATSTSTSGAGGAIPEAGTIECGATYTSITQKGPCDLLNQTCPVGQSCVPTKDSTGWTTACASSPGLKSADETCYANDECAAKLACVGITATQPGTCVAFCCPDGKNLPCNGGICNQTVDFGGATASMCSYGKPCDLLTANACPAGDDCHIDPAAGTDVALCLEPSPNPAAELAACTFINDCGDMQQCYMSLSTPTCLYYCALTGAKTSQPAGLGGCPNGETCQSSYQGAAINLGVPNIGLCIPNGGIVANDGG